MRFSLWKNQIFTGKSDFQLFRFREDEQILDSPNERHVSKAKSAPLVNQINLFSVGYREKFAKRKVETLSRCKRQLKQMTLTKSTLDTILFITQRAKWRGRGASSKTAFAYPRRALISVKSELISLWLAADGYAGSNQLLCYLMVLSAGEGGATVPYLQWHGPGRPRPGRPRPGRRRSGLEPYISTTFIHLR